MNTREYLREARLQRARQLLGEGAGNVTEVAYAVGFESLSSFARAFRQRFDCSPSEWGVRGRAGRVPHGDATPASMPAPNTKDLTS